MMTSAILKVTTPVAYGAGAVAGIYLGCLAIGLDVVRGTIKLGLDHFRQKPKTVNPTADEAKPGPDTAPQVEAAQPAVISVKPALIKCEPNTEPAPSALIPAAHKAHEAVVTEEEQQHAPAPTFPEDIGSANGSGSRQSVDSLSEEVVPVAVEIEEEEQPTAALPTVAEQAVPTITPPSLTVEEPADEEEAEAAAGDTAADETTTTAAPKLMKQQSKAGKGKKSKGKKGRN